MKKVKVMLLSLALLAVVGGALAFKAKYQSSFCYTTAFSDQQLGWTCSLPTVPAITCTTDLTVAVTTDPDPLAITSYCTTTPRFVEGVPTCIDASQNVKTCPIQTSIVGDN